MTASLLLPSGDMCPWCKRPTSDLFCDPSHGLFFELSAPLRTCTGCGAPTVLSFCTDDCADRHRASETTWRETANRPFGSNPTTWRN